MADMVESQMKVKEEDDDKTEDKFEDATSTPRPNSTEPDAHAGAASEISGGGVEGGKESSIENTDPVKRERNLSFAEGDDSSLQNHNGPQVTSPEQSLDENTSMPPPSRLSQPPSRDRSVSPGKFTSSQPGSPRRIMHGLSGDVSAPTLPPPSTSERRRNIEQNHTGERLSSPPPQPGNLARKASSGLSGLLGRMGSIRKPARSPPAPKNTRLTERRNTAASTTSTDGNGLPTIQDGAKPSLQDQFSNLRREQEFGVSETNGHVLREEDEDEVSKDVQNEGDGNDQTSPPRQHTRSGSEPIKSPTLNPSLPPGTAQGLTAGPASEPQEVNWDLWQQLVYDGPAAVSRTSGDEMRKALTSGIPPAIRGVVWQVFAESKNEELENVYRILKARGTDAEQRPTASRTGSAVDINGTPNEETIASDASSEKSVKSTAQQSGVASPPTSVESNGPELQSKLLAEKQKREAAALQKLEKAIKRDMGSRTSYSKYTQSAGLQDGLFGVCKAYALFDEGVGYAQGINFIAMPLLFNMAEEEAFTLLVRLMSKYDLRSMFTPDMAGLHLRLYQFERLLEEYEPAVYCHLKRRHVGPQLYATQWLLTLFAYRFPLQLVLRIYDLIFSEGLTAILKFGIVLMQRNRQALLEMKDMSQLTNFLKEKLFDVYIDKSPSASSLLDSGFFGSVTGGADKELYRADEMVRDACSINISDETLKAYTVEWEESQRIERERETEIENLRITNASLTAKVRVLEERAQQHDTEHVTIAQDLVRIKVENDTLLDQNEALKLQVGELQKMVDAQPAEVEQKLKEEMDRIMQRNIEVQNENRHIKEEMDETEHALVEAKMAHAQIQADYDTLKQKWSSVQAMLNDKN